MNTEITEDKNNAVMDFAFITILIGLGIGIVGAVGLILITDPARRKEFFKDPKCLMTWGDEFFDKLDKLG